MGYVIPPRPLSKAEVDKAIAEGKTTLAEIDPAFWKWNQDRKRDHRIQSIVLVVGAILMVVAFTIAFAGSKLAGKW